MTGTGTQQDPYIVDNWADFMTVNGSATATTYIKWADGGGLVDFNKVNHAGYTSAVTLKGQLDFNGWIFMNYRCTGRIFGLDNNCTVNNLNFFNFYVQSAGDTDVIYYYAPYYYTVYLNNCKFSGMINSGGTGTSRFIYNQFAYMDLSKCSASITAVTKGDFVLTNNHQNTDFNGYCKVWSKNSTVPIIDGTSKNCYYKIDHTPITADTTLAVGGGSNNINNVYEVETGSQINAVSVNGTANLSLINKDRLPQGAAVTGANVLAVTSAQLVNAAYLQSQGFSVGVA